MAAAAQAEPPAGPAGDRRPRSMLGLTRTRSATGTGSDSGSESAVNFACVCRSVRRRRFKLIRRLPS